MPNEVLKITNFDLYDPLRKKLLEAVDFSVLQGEAVHIVGENGTGKTAMIRAVFSGYRHYRGRIDLKEKNFSYLPQLSPRRPKLPITLEEICGQEYEFFSKDTMKRALAGASGGERKRAMLARIFSEDRPLIVLDEPLNHLDVAAGEQVGRWLKSYVNNGGTLIYTGHTGELPQTRKVDLEQWRC